MESLLTIIFMLECQKCDNCFEPKGDQVVCPSCRGERPRLSNLLEMISPNYKPGKVTLPPRPEQEIPPQGVDTGWTLTPEEEAWFNKSPAEY